MNKAQLVSECLPAELEAICEIRWSAWQAVGFSGERSEALDFHDNHATHWVASRQGQILGTIRACFHDSQSELPDQELLQHLVLPPSDLYCSIGRLAVSPRKHGRGLGIRLAKAAVAYASLASPIGLCAVTVPVMTKLALQLGFVEVGQANSKYVPMQRCSVMFLRLTDKPSRD